MRGGLERMCDMRPRMRFLSDELIERILLEAYKLLETRGVTLPHEALLGRLAGAGRSGQSA